MRWGQLDGSRPTEIFAPVSVFQFSISVVARATDCDRMARKSGQDLGSPGEIFLMLTQHNSPAIATAPAEVVGTSQKLRQLLGKRLRQLARVTFVLATCHGLAATALTIWWLTSLMASRTLATRSMSRRSALSTFPMIKTPSRFFGEPRKRSLPHPAVSTPRGLRRVNSRGSGSTRIAGRSNCFSRGPNNPTPRTRAEIPWSRVSAWRCWSC